MREIVFLGGWKIHVLAVIWNDSNPDKRIHIYIYLYIYTSFVVSRPKVKWVITVPTVPMVEPIFGIISLEFVHGSLLGHMPNYCLSIPR